ncbi:unnamed protein product [Allacma fusca]|uniref:Uncharacterized protein n=1 Tax=Allacma fusca TaxID=39272 RepID=A0A8J2PMX4_9HEXA|nr:unnamed protein product [Allacma fusca]
MFSTKQTIWGQKSKNNNTGSQASTKNVSVSGFYILSVTVTATAEPHGSTREYILLSPKEKCAKVKELTPSKLYEIQAGLNYFSGKKSSDTKQGQMTHIHVNTVE